MLTELSGISPARILMSIDVVVEGARASLRKADQTSFDMFCVVQRYGRILARGFGRLPLAVQELRLQGARHIEGSVGCRPSHL